MLILLTLLHDEGFDWQPQSLLRIHSSVVWSSCCLVKENGPMENGSYQTSGSCPCSDEAWRAGMWCYHIESHIHIWVRRKGRSTCANNCAGLTYRTTFFHFVEKILVVFVERVGIVLLLYLFYAINQQGNLKGRPMWRYRNDAAYLIGWRAANGFF